MSNTDTSNTDNLDDHKPTVQLRSLIGWAIHDREQQDAEAAAKAKDLSIPPPSDPRRKLLFQQHAATHAVARKPQFDKADELIEAVVKKFPPPNANTYWPKGDMARALQLNTLVVQTQQLDPLTYEEVMDGCVARGEADAVATLLPHLRALAGYKKAFATLGITNAIVDAEQFLKSTPPARLHAEATAWAANIRSQLGTLQKVLDSDGGLRDLEVYRMTNALPDLLGETRYTDWKPQ